MPLNDRDGWIWYDGELVPWRKATTHVLTHSLHYGLSVIEGLRAYRSAAGVTSIFRLAEHTRRFFDSARAFRMELPFDRAALERAQREVVRANGFEGAYLRPIAFYGSERLGVAPVGVSVHVAIAAWPWAEYFSPQAAERGLRVKTSSFARLSPKMALPKAKIAASYTNGMLARLEAHEEGYDEALMLDVDGFVAEGPGENVFIVRDGRLYEPESTSALSGVTRDSIVTLAREHGLEVRQQRLTRDDVYIADEAFFVGTAVEVTPIIELDRRAIGNGKLGPVTRSLRDAFFRVAHGQDARHQAWLTPVI